MWNDILALGNYETNYEQLLNANALGTLFFPLAARAAEPGASTAEVAGGLVPGTLGLGAFLSGVDPTAVSAEWANLLEDLTAPWVPDLAASGLPVF